MAANTYKVEYSKTGRAKCKDKDCKENIDQGVLRIAKCSIDTHFSDGDIKTDWFHAPCWFNAQKRTRPGTKVVESTDDLEGFDGLKSGDKETIKDLIAGKKGAGAKKKAKKDDSDDDDKPKKRRQHQKRRKQQRVTMRMRKRKKNRKRNARHRKRRRLNQTKKIRTTNRKRRRKRPRKKEAAAAAVKQFCSK